MNYQNLLCLGDSQTFGARTYGCYPLHLARMLSERSRYQWRAINRSRNGATARDLWFRLNEEIDGVADTYQACVLIGTNDVGDGNDEELFAEYYRQILRTLFVKKFKAVFCGTIPPVFADGHAFFPRETRERRDRLNARLRGVTAEFPGAGVVPLDHLDVGCYVDPVHFNERGNVAVAEAFAAAVLAR
jgi:lysophospholipase L1-like esterase